MYYSGDYIVHEIIILDLKYIKTQNTSIKYLAGNRRISNTFVKV